LNALHIAHRGSVRPRGYITRPRKSPAMISDGIWIIVLACASLAVIGLGVQVGQMLQ
jgi:hypothetical protein